MSTYTEQIDRHIWTTADAARALGVSGERVCQYIREGRLPAQKRGTIWWIAAQDVEALGRIRRPSGRPKGVKEKRPRIRRPKE